MKIKFLFLFICLFLAFSVKAGGPWATGKGKAYAQVGACFNRYNSIFYNGGKGNLTVNVTDNTYQFYGEFGLSDKITLITNLPFKTLHASKILLFDPLDIPTANLNGFGNISLAGKYSFWEKGVNIAAQVSLENGTNQANYQTGLRTGYGAWAVTPSIIIGKGFKKWYAFADAGFALRSAGYSEEIISNAEIGYTPFKNLWLALAFNNKNTLKNGKVEEVYGQQTSLYVNNQSYNAFGLKVSYGFSEKIGINASAYGAFAGDLVAAAPTFCASVYYKFLGKKK